MGNNTKKDKELHSIWTTKQEFKELINALNEGRNDDILDIIYKVHLRNHII